jgi:hypothetical protein
MAEPDPPPPDFYIAAMGRSGSTMLSNWLSGPPNRFVFNEPFFLRPMNSRLLRIQLRAWGMEASDAEWAQRDESPTDRFVRVMGSRLNGKRWAAKEVLCEEHRAMTAVFAPPRVIVTVRDIADVALSFFEKHRIQQNMDRFSDEWVTDYCLRESEGLVDYVAQLESVGIPFRIARYEDFARSDEERARIATFVGWPGGGDPSASFKDFDRGFEADRHAAGSPSTSTPSRSRELPMTCVHAAEELAEQCAIYQARFGYR